MANKTKAAGLQPSGKGKAHDSQYLCGNFTPICITMQKRGRKVTLCKIVVCQPLNQVVLACPYRNRQMVQYLSMPPLVLQFARQAGASLWIVRNDITGQCYSISIIEAERIGWRKPSEGGLEVFVPLTKFTPLPFQTWPYVKNNIDIDDLPLPSQWNSGPIAAIDQPQQLSFLEAAR